MRARTQPVGEALSRRKLEVDGHRRSMQSACGSGLLAAKVGITAPWPSGRALGRQGPVLYHGSAALCGHYVVHATRLREAGTPIGVNDLWIACHALAEGATLVTNNTPKFERVQGLRLGNWVD